MVRLDLFCFSRVQYFIQMVYLLLIWTVYLRLIIYLFIPWAPVSHPPSLSTMFSFFPQLILFYLFFIGRSSERPLEAFCIDFGRSISSHFSEDLSVQRLDVLIYYSPD